MRLAESIRDLDGSGVEVLVYVSKENAFTGTLPAYCRPVWSSPLLPFQITRGAVRDGVDLLHVQFEFVTFGSYLSSLLAIPLVLMMRIAGKRCIVTLHGPILPRHADATMIADMLPRGMNLPLPLIRGYVLSFYLLLNRLSSACIVQADVFRRWMDDLGASGCVVIPHGVGELNDAAPLSQDPRNASHQSILSFGFLAPRKGLDTLIRAFAELHA